MKSLKDKSNLSDLPVAARSELRNQVYLVSTALAKIVKTKAIANDSEVKAFKSYSEQLDGATKYIPLPIKIAVALALGFGTMIGWKRIVTTIGEKIGKEHLNYGQGMSAELVAMVTIKLADWYQMPVSTTHVLSSGIAGTMAANRSGLQAATMRNILLAWVLTLPVCVILGAFTFSAGLYIVLNHLVPLTAFVAGALALALIIRRLWVIAGRSKVTTAPATA